MWISVSSLTARLLRSEPAAVALVVTIAIILRLIPELLAYPHPLGYDVVNYYIPVVANLQGEWQSISDDFPLYVLVLYSIGLVTGLSPHSVVSGAAIALFGLFAFSTFQTGRTMLKLGHRESIFIAIFVIVQLAVLRTAWDLHRDLLAVSTMLIVFCLLSRKEKSWITLVLLVGLACITVAADRMVGLLFLVSLVVGSVLTRDRTMACLAALAGVLFLVPVAVTFPYESIIGTALVSGNTAVSTSSQSSLENQLVFFGVLNGIICIPALVGFNRVGSLLLRMPFLLSALAIVFGLAIPDSGFLVPERWTVLFGIFAAILAGYFFLTSLRRLGNKALATPAATVILAGFAVLGCAYAMMPYDDPFVLFALTKNQIQEFMPLTMQFNALDVQDNEKLLSTIEEINHNTENEAVIVGAEHWRGFMKLYLDGERTYKFGGNPEAIALAHAKLGRHAYVIDYTRDGISGFEFTKIEDSGRR